MSDRGPQDKGLRADGRPRVRREAGTVKPHAGRPLTGPHPKGLPQGVIKTLTLLNNEKFRLPDTASKAQIELAAMARECVIRVMLKPGRNAASSLSAARSLLEEACGKVSEQLKIDEHNVTVEIRQSPKPMAADYPPTEEERKALLAAERTVPLQAVLPLRRRKEIPDGTVT